MVYLLFFLSGISSLVYQVVWVRQFGNIFGNTAHSAGLVTSVFMFGLGVGSLLAGRYVDRVHRERPDAPLRLYGLFEVGIGVLGLVLAVVVPTLAGLSASISTYAPGAHGWLFLSPGSYLVRYLIAALLLLPSTLLMGGTLTLLIRHLLASELSAAGRRVGWLYGLNTAGAALGALLVDFALVPAVGLLATQALAAVINLGVGLAGLRLAAAVTTPSAPPADRTLDPPLSKLPRKVWLTALAIGVSGFGAMGLEMLWFRFMGITIGGYRANFSLLVSVMLVGMWLGSVTAGALVTRFARPAWLYALSQGGLVLTAVVAFLFWDPALAMRSPWYGAWLDAAEWQRPFVELVAILRPVTWLVAAPAFFMGFAYPLANAMVQYAPGTIGSRAGLVYLANTVGAVTGSLAAGFLLVPHLGMQTSLTVLAAISLSAVVPLYLARRDPPGALMSVAGLALAGALVVTVAWARLEPLHLIKQSISFRPGEAPLALVEGLTETVLVTEVQDTKDRRLYTDGYSMSTTRYSALRYMRAFAHLPLLHLDAPTRAMVICFGVGNTAHSVTLHPTIERVDVVDLSQNVVEHARFFQRWNGGAPTDPRVHIHINDGRQHLRMGDSTYDLVTLEPPPLTRAGVVSLYTREFYALARARLKPDGFVTQWLPAYQIPGPVALSAVKAFLEVFPDGILLSGYRNELILMGQNREGPPRLDPASLARRLDARPLVVRDLAEVQLASLVELFGTFAGGPRTLHHATQDVDPLVDDHPTMEYSHLLVREVEIPRSLFDTGEIGMAWCPACVGDQADRVPQLAPYLMLLQDLYETTGLRVSSTARAVPEMAPVEIDAARRKLIAGSGYLKRLFR